MPESYKEDGRPAQQWYWDDWFSAFDARLCSLAARGLWIDMLGIMWKAEIRGTLTVNGRQIDSKTIAKIVNAPVSEIRILIKELEINNVFSRLEDGTIICRRVFRESGKKDEISKIRSKIGKEGAKKRWQKITKMATSSSTPTSSSTSSSTAKKDSKVNINTEQEMQIDKELKTVKSLGEKKRGVIIQYLRELSIEFPELDYVEQMKKKIVWWLDNPLNKNSNIHLQIRNWFLKAREFLEEGDKERKVGKSYVKNSQFSEFSDLLSMEFINKVYKIIDKRGGDKGEFYNKARSAFPIIRTQWDNSDQKPETFIRLVEGVQ